MSIESDLKKEGIEITSKLDTLKVNTLAKNIAQKLVYAFPEHDFKLGELFIQLSKLDMYLANITKGLSEANYHYKNNAIYFNQMIPFEKITDFAIHECIHYLQTKKDKQGHLIRLGLCDLTKFKLHGLGLNEAAVQLASSKALKSLKESVKYYGIGFSTISPNCYPIECNLIEQMAYITGEYVLFDSTFHSTDDFKQKFIALTDTKTFATLEDNFDKLLLEEETLIKLENKLEQEENVLTVKKITKEIETTKKKIQTLFIESQNLILSSYFNHAFSQITNLEEVENYRRKLYHYKDKIGTIEDYHFFNDYYITMMAKLEQTYLRIEQGQPLTEVGLVKPNQFLRIFQMLKKLFFHFGKEYKKE